MSNIWKKGHTRHANKINPFKNLETNQPKDSSICKPWVCLVFHGNFFTAREVNFPILTVQVTIAKVLALVRLNEVAGLTW